MTGAKGEIAHAQAGRMLRSGHVIRLLAAIAVAVLLLAGAGYRAAAQLSKSELTASIRTEVDANIQLTQAVLTWLVAEDASFDHRLDALQPVAARAMEAAAQMTAAHGRMMHLSWRDGRGGDRIASDALMLEQPVDRIDWLTRRFLRGVARIAEADGSRRSDARAELRALAERKLGPELGQLRRLLTRDLTEAHRQAWLAYALGAGVVALSLAAMLWLHLIGPHRANIMLEAMVDAQRARVEELAPLLRGAERDRARAMDLSAAGMTPPVERVRAAAALLARTQLSDTQNRVLQGLRQALAEVSGRVEGMRLLAGAGGCPPAADIARSGPRELLCDVDRRRQDPRPRPRQGDRGPRRAVRRDPGARRCADGPARADPADR
jgi:hypothetical protein